MDARLISHLKDPFDGAMNMAIDQALLETVDRTGQACLRFYRWREPTLSLGYFQQSVDRQRHLPSASLTMVRRSTGGGAIVHDRELTYSLCLPADRSRRGAEPKVYRLVHDVILCALASMGVDATRAGDSGCALAGNDNAFLCFERRTDEDLVLAGYKILGSAQRRCGRAVLQHGSILLDTSVVAPSLPGIKSLVGTTIDAANLSAWLATDLGAKLGLSVDCGELSDQESRRAAHVCQTRFCHDGWVFRR